MASSKAERYKWESWSDLLKLRDFVVLDVETTGVSSKNEKIIEIAMIKVLDGERIDEFYSFINPEKAIPTRIFNLTGITDEDVKDAPRFRDIGKTIAKFLGDNVMVAHNASFDAGFLAKEFTDCGISKKIVYFDTLALARKAYPALESHKLEALVSYLGIAETQSHRALDDAEQTLHLFNSIYSHYSTPYAQAVASCCTPIVDYQIKDVTAKPLLGKHLVLMGDFTFSMKAAKKLIALAGGTIDAKLTDDTDYLMYGYFDRFKHSPKDEVLVEQKKVEYQNGAYTQPINEVIFLKMCGVQFSGTGD